MNLEYVCSVCSYSTPYASNFSRHKKKHAGGENHLKCDQCNYSTRLKYSLLRHQNSHRNNKNLIHAPFKGYPCPICSHVSSCRQDGIQHYVSGHDIALKTTRLQFTDMEQFHLWKKQFEKDTLSRFICCTRSASVDGEESKVTFRCHRDGFFKTRATGKRHLKQSGSNKINSCCPAVIKVTSDTSEVHVEVIETHVGHENDVGRLSLTAEEKEGIAAKLAATGNIDAILDEIRDDSLSHDPTRIDLVTKKDLINIARKFNLTSVPVRDPNAWASVDSWVRQNSNGAVRFYKPQGVLIDTHPQFAEDDFILVIANDPQISLLKHYGYDCVCLDGTHGLDQYDLELTTLLVVDNLRQVFPAAFMLSNKADAAFVSVFLESVKSALQVSLEPQFFMSDLSPVYFNAWIQVMTSPKIRLYCSWHVDRDWRKNLSRVKEHEKKQKVYKTVLTLLQNSEEASFQTLLQSALKNWAEDPDTADFGKYFINEYCGNVRQWASCFRRHLGLSPNMHLESTHKVLKQFYFQGKKARRLDLCIDGIMKFIRDRLYGRLIKMGKVSLKGFAWQLRHKKAKEEMKNAILSKNGEGTWTISLQSAPAAHIEIGDLNCSCTVRCVACDICIHSYKCTCYDSAIKWNICCHMHYLAMIEKPAQAEPPRLDDENCADELVADEENNSDVGVRRSSEAGRETAEFNEAKNELAREMFKILNYAKNLQDLEVIRIALAPIIPAINASREARKVKRPKRKIDGCEEMSPEETPFSQGNKKKKSESSIEKPTKEEEEVLEASRPSVLPSCALAPIIPASREVKILTRQKRKIDVAEEMFPQETPFSTGNKMKKSDSSIEKPTEEEVVEASRPSVLLRSMPSLD